MSGQTSEHLGTGSPAVSLPSPPRPRPSSGHPKTGCQSVRRNSAVLHRLKISEDESPCSFYGKIKDQSLYMIGHMFFIITDCNTNQCATSSSLYHKSLIHDCQSPPAECASTFFPQMLIISSAAKDKLLPLP